MTDIQPEPNRDKYSNTILLLFLAYIYMAQIQLLSLWVNHSLNQLASSWTPLLCVAWRWSEKLNIMTLIETCVIYRNKKKKSEKKVAINIVSNLLVNDFMFVKML